MTSLLGFLVYGGGLMLTVVLLSGLFLFVRVRRDEAVDLATGVSAYVALLIALSAIVTAVGIAYLVRAALGAVDWDFTYGSVDRSGPVVVGPFGVLGGYPDTDRDRSIGAGLALTGLAFGWVHVLLRSYISVRGLFDAGVERAVELILFLLAGAAAVLAGATALARVLERNTAEPPAPGAGGAVAVLAGAVLLWVIYGARVARGLEIGPSWLLTGLGGEGDEPADGD